MPLIYKHDFKSLLVADNTIKLVWLAMGSCAVAEYALNAKPTAVVLDLQHGLWDRLQLESAVSVLNPYCSVVARAKSADISHIAEALDSGVSSVLVPYIESVEQAKQAIAAAHYPPKGIRSAGGVRPLSNGIESMIASGKQIAVGLMVESVLGCQELEAIAALPGVDYIVIGTGDLSLSLGADSKHITKYLQQALEVCQSHQIPCGVFTPDAETALEQFSEGFQLAVVANDIGIVHSGFSAVAQFFAKKN